MKGGLTKSTAFSSGLRLAVLGLGMTACAHGGSSESTGSSAQKVTLQAAEAGVVSTVSGYGNCTDPACSDVARACDDIIRSGCGTPFLRQRDGAVPSTPTCSSEFSTGIANCTAAVWSELGDILERVEGDQDDERDAGEPSRPTRSVLAVELAKCTRRATTCAERLECTRGVFIPPPVTYDAGPFAPPPDASPPPPPERPPFPAGPSGPSTWTGAPWQDSGVPPVDLMPGIDSPSCAACAIQRCPTFAYRCFSAEYNFFADCADGDCCHSYRKCISACGGYSPSATITQFYVCSAQCSAGRPRAATELADLQRCAAEACSGCQAFDKQAQQGEGQP